MDELASVASEALVEGLRKAYDLLSGNELDEAEVKDLRDKHILIDTLPSSDLRHSDIEQGKSEFLIFVLLSHGSSTQSASRVFEEKVLYNRLLNEERVRTVEVCEQTVHIPGGYLEAHYILHVVGYLRDVSDIVLERIHQTLDGTGIECGTRVVPIATALAAASGAALGETVVGDHVQQVHVFEIIKENVGEETPFLIKRLEKKYLDEVSSIWLNANVWLAQRELARTPQGVIRNTRHQLARCLYYIGHVLTTCDGGILVPQMQTDLWSYCGDFYRVLAGTIEGFLLRLVNKKAGKLGDGFKTRLAEYWRKGTKGSEELSLPDLNKISLGQLLQIVIYWNKKTPDSDYIGDEQFATNLQALQGSGIADFRDCLAHTHVGLTAAITKHLATKKDVRRLLHSIDGGLRLILKEKDYD
jgi:hypothetical protein